MKTIKKIYGIKNCVKCNIAKDKFKNADYVLLDDLTEDKKTDIIKKVQELGITIAPILEDEDGNVITHQEGGL